MRSRTVTQRDIAKLLGIHQTAVSFALRGEQCVSEETRQRVQQAAKDLGYNSETHHAARLMQNSRYGIKVANRTIAIINQLLDTDDPYNLDVMLGIAEVMKQAGYDILLCNIDPRNAEEFQNSPNFMRGYIDGVLLHTPVEVPMVVPSVLLSLLPSGSRSVVCYPGEIASLSAVSVNEAQGAYQATRHLLEMGHRQILQFKPLGCEHLWRKRLGGIQQAFYEFGLDPAAALHLLELSWGWIDPRNDFSQLPPLTPIYDEQPQPTTTLPDYLQAHQEVTALLAWNDPSAIHAWLSLQEAGYHIPEKISIVGFDDTHAMYDARQKNVLTSVHQPLFQVGEQAAQRLLAQITDENAPIQCTNLPCELSVRQSTRRLS